MNNDFIFIRSAIFVILIFSGVILAIGSTLLASKDAVAGVDESINNLPPSFSWRDINGVDFTTQAKNQVGNTCEAYALCGAIETMVQYKVGYPFGCDLSEAHLFLCSGGTHWGTYLEDTADFLVKYGAPDQIDPFPEEDAKQIPINCPYISITVEDRKGDPFNVAIYSNYVNNVTYNNQNNGTFTATLVIPLPGNTDIIWYVNATDINGNEDITTYKFKTFIDV